MKVKAATAIAASPAQVSRAAVRRWNPLQPRGRNGNEGAQGQFPGPGERREVGRGGMRSGLDDGEPVRGGDDDNQGDRHLRLQGEATLQAGHEQEQGRIDDVELLFDGQGPEVL